MGMFGRDTQIHACGHLDMHTLRPPRQISTNILTLIEEEKKSVQLTTLCFPAGQVCTDSFSFSVLFFIYLFRT